MEEKRALQAISDDELLRRLAELTRDSRRVESDLVAHIAEVDGRRLYAREASPSMFAYCTDVLHLSEAEAYLRITAARASRRHPLVLSMLADGRLHLSGIGRLAPHLKGQKAERLLERAVHKSKRQIEELIAELFPRPDAPGVMRKLPAPSGQVQLRAGLSLGEGELSSSVELGSIHELRPGGVPMPDPETRLQRATIHRLLPDEVAVPELPDRLALRALPSAALPAGRSLAPANAGERSASPATAPAASSVVQPLAPARYKVQFTASAALHHKLERLRALMRTQVPDGDLAAIIEEAVTEKLKRLEGRRFATTKSPRKSRSKTVTSPSSRRIPAAVRRAVYERDGSRCRFVDGQGRHCTERDRLEFHHRHPFALGGNHDPENLRLYCTAHNQYLAEQDYGKQAMARHRRSRNQASQRVTTPPP